jgi:calcineurin-like phosphoesterase family protein
MAIYFTADHHFGDSRARTFYRRPFASVAEMDEEMVNKWNSVVAPADEVWYLGDFAMRPTPDRIANLLGTLNGQKHLIAGNNDCNVVKECSGWISVANYAEVIVNEIRLVLCHYPFRTWRDMGKGAINLHGHSHGRLKGLPRQFDIGVDAWEFRPVTLDTILNVRLRRARKSAT